MTARPKGVTSTRRKDRLTDRQDQAPRAVSVVGNLDRVDPDGVVEGWCWSPDEPDTRRVIAILVDGVEVATAPCREHRPDLAKAAIGDGSHGFLVVLPPGPRRSGAPVAVALREQATGQMVGSTLLVTWRDDTIPPVSGQAAPAPALQGHVDGVTRDGRISGWCWSPDDPLAHLRLQIIVDDAVVGLAAAIDYRPDLEQAGIGDGTHGFSFALPWSVLASKGTLSILVRDEASLMPLGAPILLRLGRLSGAEDRMVELERQIRLMRAQIDELTRDLDARADDRPLSDLFATIGTMFDELARAPSSLDAPQALARWRQNAPSVPADPAGLLRQAITALQSRHAPFELAIPDRPIATIAIPARADTAALYRCLSALRAAGVDRMADIVLIDDGDPAGMGHCAALLPGLVRNVHLLHAPGGFGLASALNELARTARGALLGYVDPALTLTPGWLDEIADSFAREPESGMIGGKVVGGDGLLRHAGLLTGPDGLPGAVGLHDDAGRPEFSHLREVDGLAALALVIRRDALALAGGWPEGFGSDGAMVLDLGLRVRLSGHSVLYQPRALAVCADGFDVHASMTDFSGADDDGERLRQAWFDGTPGQARPRPVGFVGHALVIDTEMPRADRDSGSVAALEQMQLLRRLGYRVTFAAASGPALPGATAETLEGLGIALVRAPYDASISDYLARQGAGLDLVQIYRHTNATLFLERVRELAPRARIVFAPADLHHLREMRHAAVAGHGATDAGLLRTREQELHCVRRADVTLLNSDFEYELLKSEAEPGRLVVLRWIIRPSAPARRFADRSGLCFIGNFRHAPNADGVRWFVQSVMPRLRAGRAGITLHIAGSEMTEAVRALAGPDVVVHGWVENLSELFERTRLSVAPLRYGAGFKGKVALSLAHGLPVVGTAIAIEGTGLADGQGVVVADTATQFAAEVMQLHEDADLWSALSVRALERCRALYSPEAALSVYRRMLRGLGLPVLGD